jgi:hypothetical protein
MSSWGNNDNAANAPYWAVNSAIAPNNPNKASPTAANVALLYGNTRPDVYTTGETIGLFMVDTGEVTAGAGIVTDISIIQGGTQYAEAPTVTFTGGGGSSAAATATIAGGVVTRVAVSNGGSSYETKPTVSMNKPTITMAYTEVNTSTDVFTYSGTDTLFATGDAVIPVLGSGNRIVLDVATFANTAINTTSNIVTLTAHPFVTGDYVRYSNGGGTTPTGITNNNYYFIQSLSNNTVALYDTYEHVIRQATIPDGLGIVDFSTQGAGATMTLTGYITTDKPYYVIRTGAKTFKLARTAALAAVPTAIDITGQGTGSDKGFINQTATAATAIADLGLSGDGSGTDGTQVAHAGWNIKIAGSGGRAGRVQWETLVATSDQIGDGSDDITLPDA